MEQNVWNIDINSINEQREKLFSKRKKKSNDISENNTIELIKFMVENYLTQLKCAKTAYTEKQKQL